MTSAHVWTLMNILPNIAGELLKDNIHYLHFISLLEIFRLLNDDVYDENKIKRIEDSIYYYLLEFKVFFPNKKITPKQHFMVHYGRLIRQFGAPKTYMTLRFESKHGYFKRVNNANHNYINPTRSFANRHQSLQVYHLMSPQYFKTDT